MRYTKKDREMFLKLLAYSQKALEGGLSEVEKVRFSEELCKLRGRLKEQDSKNKLEQIEINFE